MIEQQQKPCWTITCDLCGQGDNSEYETHYHWDTREQAVENARDSDWLIGDGNVTICLYCLEGAAVPVACPTCGVHENQECADPHGGRALLPCPGRIAALVEKIRTERPVETNDQQTALDIGDEPHV